MLKAGEVDVVVSTGNTKALVAAGTIKVRPMEGAERPALAAIMPRREGHFIMLDVGANPEATPAQMVHNAVLGSIYAQSALGIASPRVGLLSVGTEEGKGGPRINRTHTLLKAMGQPPSVTSSPSTSTVAVAVSEADTACATSVVAVASAVLTACWAGLTTTCSGTSGTTSSAYEVD
jgi:hypothetical protein